MTTPEEMAGRRRVYKVGDIIRVRGIEPSVRIIGIGDPFVLVRDDRTGTLYDAYSEHIEGVLWEKLEVGDLNPRTEQPTAKAAALTASAASVLATTSDILATYERGDHTPQKFAALGKRLVRGVARHAVLECVPAFVFEAAK